jgi:hypothetical protein
LGQKKNVRGMVSADALREQAFDAVYSMLTTTEKQEGTFRAQQQGVVVQLTQRVQVETPASCGTDSSIVTSDDAAIEFHQSWERLRTTSEDDIAAIIMKTAVTLAHAEGKTLVVAADTKKRIVAQLKTTLDGIIQQETHVNQIIHRVRVNVCHVVMGNSFALTLVANTAATKGVDVLVQSTEWQSLFPNPVTAAAALADDKGTQDPAASGWDAVLVPIVGLIVVLVVFLIVKKLWS